MWEVFSNDGILLACENSRPSSLPARVAFHMTDTRVRSEGGQLFLQASILPLEPPLHCQLVPVQYHEAEYGLSASRPFTHHNMPLNLYQVISK